MRQFGWSSCVCRYMAGSFVGGWLEIYKSWLASLVVWRWQLFAHLRRALVRRRANDQCYSIACRERIKPVFQVLVCLCSDWKKSESHVVSTVETYTKKQARSVRFINQSVHFAFRANTSIHTVSLFPCATEMQHQSVRRNSKHFLGLCATKRSQTFTKHMTHIRNSSSIYCIGDSFNNNC